MWLLNTTSAERKFFLTPADVPGGYVILSHVWLRPGEGEEDTFQKVGVYSESDRFRSIEENTLSIGQPPSGPVSSSTSDSWGCVSSKIQGFLKVAQASGYEWAWADTCCIDKTSSSDLSEAINSMFSYMPLRTSASST